MDDFRNDVSKLLNGNSTSTNSSTTIIQPNTTLPALVYTRLLKRGRDGEDVKKLQEALIKLGYSCGSYGADGDFGAGTEAAVIAFQRKNNLDDDGEAGPMTIAKINELLTKNNGNNQSSSGNNSQASSATTPTTGPFRVSKSWSDAKSQVGAFSNIQNAKNACDNAGPGYYVFDYLMKLYLMKKYEHFEKELKELLFQELNYYLLFLQKKNYFVFFSFKLIN